MSTNFNDFVRKRMACPLNKKPVTMIGDNFFRSSCGFTYENGDFRVGLEFSTDWQSDQQSFVNYMKKDLERNEAHPGAYDLIDRETADIYDAIHLSGDIADIGGGWGSVVKQANLDQNRYVSIDPAPSIWHEVSRYKRFHEHYDICEKLPYLLSHAEFLPLLDETFDVVHMRSCLDHFANPLLALKEAYRILRSDGRLVIGVSLEGAYKKLAPTFKQRMKRSTL